MIQCPQRILPGLSNLIRVCDQNHISLCEGVLTSRYRLAVISEYLSNSLPQLWRLVRPIQESELIEQVHDLQLGERAGVGPIEFNSRLSQGTVGPAAKDEPPRVPSRA